MKKTPTELGAAIVQQIKNQLAAIDGEEKLTAATITELEAKGYRIVGGSDVVTDWRIGAVLARGVTPDHDCPEDWYHIDHIHEETWGSVEVVRAKGLTDRLAGAIEELVQSHEQELRAWLA
jgi:hypothetical protein